MNHSNKTILLARTALRHFSKTAAQNAEAEVVTPKFQKLKETQKRFGVENNVPVYLKGGIVDKILYQTTILITFVGLGLSFETFYRLAIK